MPRESWIALNAWCRLDRRQPIELTLERDGRQVVVTYQPLGASGRGEAWRRRLGADATTCPR